MFTIKLYGHTGRTRILAADSFTVISDDRKNIHEISLHGRDVDSVRYDVGPWHGEDSPPEHNEVFAQAYIVNANGKTVASYRSDGPI